MSKYLAILEKTNTGPSAYAPDMPLVVATGKTCEEARMRIEAAMRLWMDETRAAGLPVPSPNAQIVLVETR
jgi:predicted RNase H-like HicB family nuclease